MADETKRPGGWVDGIGWVAKLSDLNDADECTRTEWACDGEGIAASVVRSFPSPPHAVAVMFWADGTGVRRTEIVPVPRVVWDRAMAFRDVPGNPERATQADKSRAFDALASASPAPGAEKP